MLVLTRAIGERIFIGDNIVITVVEFRGNQIRLGIEAPRSIPVLREELLTTTQKDTFNAPTTNSPATNRYPAQDHIDEPIEPEWDGTIPS